MLSRTHCSATLILHLKIPDHISSVGVLTSKHSKSIVDRDRHNFLGFSEGLAVVVALATVGKCRVWKGEKQTLHATRGKLSCIESLCPCAVQRDSVCKTQITNWSGIRDAVEDSRSYRTPARLFGCAFTAMSYGNREILLY